MSDFTEKIPKPLVVSFLKRLPDSYFYFFKVCMINVVKTVCVGTEKVFFGGKTLLHHMAINKMLSKVSPRDRRELKVTYF